MARFPFIKQLDAMDCGAVSLNMIAAHYGKVFDIDRLRDLTYMTKEGVSLFSISEAAEQLGFKTLGGKITFEKLEKEAVLPCIVVSLRPDVYRNSSCDCGTTA